MGHQASTTGQPAVRVEGKFPDVSVAAGRKGFKAELDGLRERMHELRFSTDDAAAEIGRRYRLRPREAYRLAWGWSLEQAETRFNDCAARQDAAPEARASLTGSRLSQFEHWPRTERKPSVYTLFMLAQIYETDVLCLLDLADHENPPQQDRLVLLRKPRPSARVTARLDDVLEAGGELAALAETAEIVTGDSEPPSHGNPPGQTDGSQAQTAGLSLSLPYVPGRLVIEVSGPAAIASLAPGENAATAGRRLALVRDVTSPGTPGREVTGA
jgi:hypothetical protein